MMELRRRLVAEALGTSLLVATVIGSGIMADSLTQDMALALLANTIATGAILVVLISILGGISGAHFNPVVSLVMWMRRELDAKGAALYGMAQIVGGISGAVLANLMFGHAAFELAEQARTSPAQWLSEGVATFGLLTTILLGIAYGKNVAHLVGLYITAAYWFTASTSFANPAVTIARAFSDSFAGIRLMDVPAFIAVQLAGALLAMALAGWIGSATEKA